MTNTPIEWTDFSVNPIRFRNKATGKVGHFCEKISPGCKFCYSDKMQQGPYLSGLAFLAENADRGESFFDEAVLEKVLKRRKPARIFWCDMTDMFGRWVPDEWIDRCFAVMAATPHLTHQVLTKRADRLAGYGYPRRGVLPNVWLGVSVEDQQRADERIPLLLQTPAAVRFLSVEPLLGPVDLAMFGDDGLECNYCKRWRGTEDGAIPDGKEEDPGYLCPKCGEAVAHLPLDERLDWVIVGGESGPGARPCDVAHVRSIVQQCRAAGVACFVKQLGAHVTGPEQSVPEWVGKLTTKGGNWEVWPKDLRVREMPQQGEAHRPDGRGASNL